jgi:peptide deformylase
MGKRSQRCKTGPRGPGIARGRAARYLTRMTDATEAPSAEAERLSILIAPDPALRRTARPVGPDDAETVRDLIPRMLATMYAAPGIGLAAPQIGLGLRLAVIDLQREERREPIVLINPEIVAASAETETREEGCLSLPDQYADVTRPRAVTVRYLGPDGVRRTIEAEGLMARCLQHEIDHLDGVLFIDHISSLRRSMILRRLAKVQREKAQA